MMEETIHGCLCRSAPSHKGSVSGNDSVVFSELLFLRFFFFRYLDLYRQARALIRDPRRQILLLYIKIRQSNFVQ